jgi:hypothetical protein
LRILSNLVGIPNGPVDLDGLRLLIIFSTSKVLVGKITKLLQIGLFRKVSNGMLTVDIALAILEPMLEK